MAARGPLVALCFVVSLLLPGFGQQSPSGSAKVPASGQLALQRQLEQAEEARASLHAKAQQAFDAEMAQEQAGDCRDAHNTREPNRRYQKALGATNENLETYAKAIHDLLSLKEPDLTGQPRMPAPAGPPWTPEESAAGFGHILQAWFPHLDAVCTAAFHLFGGGTGASVAEGQCRLRLMRNHMRELDQIYNSRVDR